MHKLTKKHHKTQVEMTKRLTFALRNTKTVSWGAVPGSRKLSKKRTVGFSQTHKTDTFRFALKISNKRYTLNISKT